jgi:two-component system sensor histidine kinase CiaH
MNQEILNKTRNELTILFFSIQLIVILILNIAIIFFDFGQVNRLRTRFMQHQPVLIQIQPNKAIFDEEALRRIEADAQQQRQERLIFILSIDIMLSLLAAVFARYLANTTLKPLIKNIAHQKQFVSTASHELRTPLTIIKAEADMLLRNKKSSLNDYKNFSKNTIVQVDNMTDLTQSLLYLAKAENHSDVRKKEIVNINKTVESVLNLHKLGISKKEIDVRTNGLSHNVKTNKELFTRLISIIIDNAIKFNKDAGKIEITFDSETSKLNISDTGKGINSKDLPYIFEAFYKGNSIKKGFGIGLAIASNIAQLLKIKIEVTSKVDLGTTFTLDLYEITVRP